jgi:hypothetical protein
METTPRTIRTRSDLRAYTKKNAPTPQAENNTEVFRENTLLQTQLIHKAPINTTATTTTLHSPGKNLQIPNVLFTLQIYQLNYTKNYKKYENLAIERKFIKTTSTS